MIIRVKYIKSIYFIQCIIQSIGDRYEEKEKINGNLLPFNSIIKWITIS